MLQLFKNKPEPNRDESVNWPRYEMPFREYTPDLPVLQQYFRQLVFVYGEDQQGHRRHDAFGLEPINPNGKPFVAYTELPFVLWKKSLGEHSYPIALAHGFPLLYPPTPLMAVKGELYKINPRQDLIDLDNCRRNGVMFKRVRISLYVPYKRYRWTKRYGSLPPTHESKRIRAWAYVGIPSYWDEQINAFDGFKPVKQIISKNPHIPDHYQFTKSEYDE